MSNINANTKHDFINNSLRLEILSKLITESITKDEIPKKQFMDDFEKFLNIELNLLEDIKNQTLIN